MKVALVSHSAVVDVYQDKFRHLAQFPNIELTIIIPEAYKEGSTLVPGFEGTGEYTVLRLPVFLGKSGKQNAHFYRSLLPTLQRLQPDILHLEEEPESLVTAQGIRCAQKLSPRPTTIVYTWRNIVKTHKEWPRTKAQRYVYPLTERYVLRHADAVVAGNREVVDICRTSMGCTHPMYIIPHGVNPETYYKLPANPALKQKLGLRGTVIGYIGRMLHMKGLESLIRAYAQTLHSYPDSTLLLLGAGPDQPLFENIAVQLGIRDRVVFHNFVPVAEVVQYINLMDMMVLPSLTVPDWKEQLGRVLLEAMACEVPIIGSSSGEIPHVIANTGLVFPEGNVDALSAAMLRYLHSPEERQQYGIAGKQRLLEEYSNQQVARKMYTMYCELLGKKGKKL